MQIEWTEVAAGSYEIGLREDEARALAELRCASSAGCCCC